MEIKKGTARIIMHPATQEFLAEKGNFIHVKPYSTKELTNLYGVSDKTFRKWIEPFKEQIGEKRGAYYSVRQVRIIFEKLDIPHMMLVA